VDTRQTSDTLLSRTMTLMLRSLAGVIVAVTVLCFAQSYRQLLDWATRHQVPLWIAPAWPLGIDAFVIIAEIVLFVSIVRRWPMYTRWLAWGVAVAGLTASIVAQWLYIPGAGLLTRGTSVVAPLGATLGLALGLIVLKWTVAEFHATTETQPASVAAQVAARIDRTADELAQQRRKRVRGKTLDVSGARTFISAERAAGREPAAYAVAMRYLGGDVATRRRGNERRARELLDEGAQ